MFNVENKDFLHHSENIGQLVALGHGFCNIKLHWVMVFVILSCIRSRFYMFLSLFYSQKPVQRSVHRLPCELPA